MHWNQLTDLHQLDEIVAISQNHPVVIFKHSTRCNISSVAKFRLEDDWNFSAEEIEPYYLDLLQHKDISNIIAEKFQVWHESPQVLLIANGECVYDASHLDISVAELQESLTQIN